MIEHFSSGYYIVDADVVPYNGERVIVPHDMMEEVQQHAPVPLFKLNNSHYMADSESGVPGETLAVPEFIDHDDEDPILLAKPETALQRVLEIGRGET